MADGAVAHRYAEALYALAKEEGRTRDIFMEVVELKVSLDASKGVWGIVLNPRTSPQEKMEKLGDLLAERDPIISNFLRSVFSRRREDILRVFFPIYLKVHEHREGILRVRVETARKMDPEVEGKLLARLKEVTGGSVVMETRSDEALLGGMRFVIGSEVIDGSVRGRLERLRRQLVETSLQ